MLYHQWLSVRESPIEFIYILIFKIQKPKRGVSEGSVQIQKIRSTLNCDSEDQK